MYTPAYHVQNLDVQMCNTPLVAAAYLYGVIPFEILEEEVARVARDRGHTDESAQCEWILSFDLRPMLSNTVKTTQFVPT